MNIKLTRTLRSIRCSSATKFKIAVCYLAWALEKQQNHTRMHWVKMKLRFENDMFEGRRWSHHSYNLFFFSFLKLANASSFLLLLRSFFFFSSQNSICDKIACNLPMHIHTLHNAMHSYALIPFFPIFSFVIFLFRCWGSLTYVPYVRMCTPNAYRLCITGERYQTARMWERKKREVTNNIIVGWQCTSNDHMRIVRQRERTYFCLFSVNFVYFFLSLVEDFNWWCAHSKRLNKRCCEFLKKKSFKTDRRYKEFNERLENI